MLRRSAWESFANFGLGDVSSWAATGLWHPADSSTCASPALGYSSPTHAFYYGQDATSDYNTGASNSGTLTSPIVVGIRSTSTLTFQYLREVESEPFFPFDVTSVDIVTDSGTTTVWSLSSQDPSTAAWTSSGAISLSAFAGEKIRVRFRCPGDIIEGGVDDVRICPFDGTLPPPPPSPCVSAASKDKPCRMEESPQQP